MTTMTNFRHRLATRRRRAELQRVLRQADPRLRAELMTIAQRDLSWY